MWRYFPRAQLSGIDVYHRSGYPITNFERGPSGRVAIGLTARKTRWAQYAFQFAHEFCHALANFSDNTSAVGALSKTCQFLAGREPVRNGFLVYFAGHEPLVEYRPALSGLEELRSMAQPLCGAAPRPTRAPPSARDVIPGLVQAERARPPSEPGRAPPKHGYRDPAFAPVRGRPTRMGGIGIPQSRSPPRGCVASPTSGRVAIPVPAGPPSLPRQACGSLRSQALAATPKALAGRPFVGRLREWSSTRLAAIVL